MIDLTPYFSAAAQKQIGPLFISDMAAEELGLIIAGHCGAEFATPRLFLPTVAVSVADFLTSDYFKRSAWFRKQEVHLTAICSVRHGDTTTNPIFHVLKCPPRGYRVISPDEAGVPDSYYHERLIAEVCVETGIIEIADPQERG